MAKKQKTASQTTSGVRDRIKRFDRVLASELVPHPNNWRTHPEKQRAAVSGILCEIGYADALIVRELENGTLQIIDGHLRADLDPNQMVPVLVLDVSESEGDKLLLTLDPLAELAEADTEHLQALLEVVQTGDQALAGVIADLAQAHDIIPSNSELAEDGDGEGPAASDTPRSSFQLIVTCRDEEQQKQLYEALAAEGHDVEVVA